MLRWKESSDCELGALMISWHVIIAAAGALKKTVQQLDGTKISIAEASLRALGHQVYHPLERLVYFRLSRRILRVRNPFGMYAFIGVGADACFNAIAKAKGVRRIMRGLDGEIELVDPNIIEEYRRAEQCGEYDMTRRRKDLRLFNEGDLVRVVDGPFKGWEGVVQRCGPIEAHVELGGRMNIIFPPKSLRLS